MRSGFEHKVDSHSSVVISDSKGSVCFDLVSNLCISGKKVSITYEIH
jgi:hypothetical protein